jgi:hypothetical protein
MVECLPSKCHAEFTLQYGKKEMKEGRKERKGREGGREGGRKEGRKV